VNDTANQPTPDATCASDSAAWERPHTSWSMWRPMSIPGAPEPAPLVVRSASGVHLTDVHGRRHLDMTASLGYVNVGYDCPEIKAAIARQLDTLPTFSCHGAYAHPVAIELAERLTALTAPERMSRVLFSNGGSDAMETALKLARQYWRLSGKPEKTGFVSFKLAYHGVGMGGVSASGIPGLRGAYGPVLPGFHHILPPYGYRYPGRLEGNDLAMAVANELHRTITFLGADTLAGFVAEPIQCASGVLVPPDVMWRALRAVCNQHDLLLIADEVVTGFGRTGEWFGARRWQTRPDIICLAKGINSGYVPLGATLFNERVAAAWSSEDPTTAIQHGYTYSGHPLACAAAMANLDVIERDRLVDNAAAVGTYLNERLQVLAGHPLVGQIRQCGLMVGVELVADRTTRAPLDFNAPAHRTIRETIDRSGVRVRCSGNTLILTPPLVITTEHVDTCVEAMGAAFVEAEHATTPTP